MPKKPMDYSKACIYKIACKDPNITDVYVGSTTNLAKRRYRHKSNCNNLNSSKYNLNVYQFIRDHGGFDNFEIIKLENFPCASFEELAKQERQWLEELGATLNKLVPSRTTSEYKKQYYQDNQDKICEYGKQYHQQNRYKILERKKQRYEQNREKFLKKNDCECGGTYTLVNKARHLKTTKHQNYLKTLE